MIVQYMVRLWDNDDEGDYKTRAIIIDMACLSENKDDDVYLRQHRQR